MLYLYGWLVARLAVRWLRINPADPLSLAQTGLPGLGAVGTLPAALSLFISLDALAASLLLLGALLIGLDGLERAPPDDRLRIEKAGFCQRCALGAVVSKIT